MRALIIGNQPPEVDTVRYYDEYADFFQRAAGLGEANTIIDWTRFDDLYIEVGDSKFTIVDTKNGYSLDECELLLIIGRELGLFRDVMYAISRYAKLNDVRVINDYSNYRSGSKLTQAVLFHEANLSVPLTVYVDQAILNQNITLPFGFPCIMKAVLGAHGNDNHVVRSIEDVRLIANTSNNRYVLQRFVPNDYDLRILVVGNETIVISRKAVEGSHLNNTSQGGSAALVPLNSLPDGLIDDAMMMARRLDMGIAGVDAIIDKTTGKYSFLEVNSQPQLVTGAFLEDKKRIIGDLLRGLGD